MSQEAETIVTEEAESSPNDVAQTILQQLGGRMFIAMTGARHLTSSEGGLAFKLPSNFATDGINHVIIRLNWRDTYDVTFGKTFYPVVEPVGVGNHHKSHLVILDVLNHEYRDGARHSSVAL